MDAPARRVSALVQETCRDLGDQIPGAPVTPGGPGVAFPLVAANGDAGDDHMIGVIRHALRSAPVAGIAAGSSRGGPSRSGPLPLSARSRAKLEKMRAKENIR